MPFEMATKRITSNAYRYYEGTAEHYDRLRWGHHHGRGLDHWQSQALFGLLGNIQNATVLEIGCGTGRMALRVSPRCRQLIAVDFSKKMMKALLRKIPPQMREKPRPILAAAPAIPLPASSVDIIFFVNTIQLLGDLETLFTETYRLLRPAGHLVFNYPNLSGIFCPYGVYRNRVKKARGNGHSSNRPTRWFTRGYVHRMMGDSGFGVIEESGQPLLAHERVRAKKWPIWFCPSVFVKAVKT